MTGIRDWGEEGATPEELALLAASKSELPSSASRTRTLAALGVGAIVTSTASATAAVATSTGVLGIAAKITGALVVVGAVAGGGYALYSTGSSGPVPAAARASSGVAVAPVAPVAPVEGVPVAPPASAARAPEEMAPSASRAVPSVQRPRAAASSDTLPKEVAALERAHAALAARDADAALRALDRYHAQFPQGVLSSEERMLRVKAELLRGDKQRAAALADELRTADPESPYSKRVDDLVLQKKQGEKQVEKKAAPAGH